MAEPPPELSEDSLFTAARRLVRNVRVDDASGGGLLSVETIKANEIVARHLEAEEREIRE